MLRQRFGILGTLGILLLVVWAVGFFVFGMHEGVWHVLFPVGAVMLIVQGVWRVHV